MSLEWQDRLHVGVLSNVYWCDSCSEYTSSHTLWVYSADRMELVYLGLACHKESCMKVLFTMGVMENSMRKMPHGLRCGGTLSYRDWKALFGRPCNEL